MDVELDCSFPEFDRGQFTKWLASVETPEGMLSAPLCAEPKPPTPAVVEVVVGEEIIDARFNPRRVPENSVTQEKKQKKPSEALENPKIKTRTRPRRARKPTSPP